MRFIEVRSPVEPYLIKYLKWLLRTIGGSKDWQRAYFAFSTDNKGVLCFYTGRIVTHRGPQGTMKFSPFLLPLSVSPSPLLPLLSPTPPFPLPPLSLPPHSLPLPYSPSLPSPTPLPFPPPTPFPSPTPLTPTLLTPPPLPSPLLHSPHSSPFTPSRTLLSFTVLF